MTGPSAPRNSDRSGLDVPHELAVDGLRAGVPGREVLFGVDLVVRSGEVHAVMGPNGSGKSTLAHVLMGKPGYQVLSGRVTFDGEDVLAMAPWERARLGLFLAPQNPIEVPGVRLTDVLAAALSSRAVGAGDAVGAEPAESAEAGPVAERASAESVRLGFETRLLDRALNVDLSGGERKRSETLQLAVIKPHIAVLDELDSGLDIDGLRVVARRVLAAVDEWGLGVLAITHYRRLLSILVPDVVHVLVDGRVVAEGGPELAEEVDRTGYASY
ncbi:MAG: Fe-S cluster assembly ATPase SufC [Acidimicrobiales bacterium]